MGRGAAGGEVCMVFRRKKKKDLRESVLVESVKESIGAGTCERVMDMTGWYIAGKCMKELTESVTAPIKQNDNIQLLNLSFNGLQDQDILTLMKALVKNSTLNELNVSNNFIGWNGASAFAKLLDQSRCPQ